MDFFFVFVFWKGGLRLGLDWAGAERGGVGGVSCCPSILFLVYFCTYALLMCAVI